MNEPKNEDKTRVSLPGGASLDAATPSLTPEIVGVAVPNLGAVMSERYELLSATGVGGMSIIYRATERETGKIFAIKMLNSLLMNETSLRRFQQEARAITSLRHPNIISVHDYGVSESGHPYMVMDFVEGKNLGEVIKEKGALSIEESLPRFLQICDALEHAHHKGVLHRDIKPSNIMLSSDDGSFEDARLVDFGIAKVISKEGDEIASTLTQTGELFGSPPYMSPEQCRGTSAVDKRSDIYSMGCVMYETLTGRPPLRGSTIVETLMMHMNEVPVSLKEACPSKQFSPKLEHVIAKCLAKDPKDRFQTMDQLKFQLMQLNSDEDGDSVKIHASRKPFKISKISKPIVIGIACFVIGLLSRSLTPINTTAPFSATAEPSTPSAPVAQLVEPREHNSAGNGEKVSDAFLAAYIRDPQHRHQRDLMLGGKIWLTDKGLKDLSALKSLKEIELDNTMITDKTVTQIASLPELDKLSLTGTMITDAGVKQLAKLDTLSELKLGTTDITDASMPTVGKFDGLDKLYLENTAIGDKGVSFLSNVRPQVLRIGHTHITDPSMGIIGNMTSLTRLNANDNKISDGGIAKLGKLFRLRELDISRTQCTDRGLAALQNLAALEVLCAACPGITDSGIASLRKLPALISLDLDGANITDRSAAQIAQLKVQDLSLGHTKITDAALPELAKMPNLRNLDLSNTSITSEGIKALGKLHGHLKTLIIPNCPGVMGSNSQMRADLRTTIIYSNRY